MCKVLMVIGSNNPENLLKFAKASAGPMSVGNNDGLGYTAIKKDGSIFTERWLNNKDAFEKRTSSSDKSVVSILKDFIKESVSEKVYSLQGKADLEFKEVKTLLLHTRFATSAKGFNNTHPFVCNDNITSIIHNGVINNHSVFKKLNSTCDSEIILTEYMKRNLANEIDKLPDLCNAMQGYWAVGATSLTSDGKRIVDVFKDGAQLSMTYVEQLGAVVLCTSEMTLTSIFKSLGWEHSNSIYTVKDNVHVRFDGITGKVLKVKDFNSEIVTFPPQVSNKTNKFSNYGKSFNQVTNTTKEVGSSSNGFSSRTSEFYDYEVDHYYDMDKVKPIGSTLPEVLTTEQYALIDRFEKLLKQEDYAWWDELDLTEQLNFARQNLK